MFCMLLSITITDAEQLLNICDLFAKAMLLDYEPKTHSFDLELPSDPGESWKHGAITGR